MKRLISLIFLPSCFFTQCLHAQSLDGLALLESGEIGLHGEFWPKSFETLVRSSSIIVKGRFGEHLSNELFWGFDRNNESGLVSRESYKEKYGDTDEETDLWGFPVSHYEIRVNEVLLGNIQSNTIIYSILENSPTSRRLTLPSVDRLFFLRENPDGTYTPLGLASVLNDREGFYSYDALDEDDPKAETHEETYDFAPSMRVDDFENKLKEEMLKFEIAID